MVAEALIEFDELFQIFRAHHIYLIHRSIGMGSKSLKGVRSNCSMRAHGIASSPDCGTFAPQ